MNTSSIRIEEVTAPEDIRSWTCTACKSANVAFNGRKATAGGQELDHEQIDCLDCGRSGRPWPARQFTANDFMDRAAAAMAERRRELMLDGMTVAKATKQAVADVLALVPEDEAGFLVKIIREFKGEKRPVRY
jgi:RNase P subunit RPR2